MRPRDAEIDRLGERGFHRRLWKQCQRVAGDGAVMVGAANRVFERAVLGHKPDGVLEIGVIGFAALQGAPPEFALGVGAAAEGEHHRKRDLALAEIVADVLAELLRGAAIIEHVVDQLERDAEIYAERAAGGLLVAWPRRQHRADFAGCCEQLRGLGADHRDIFVFVVAVFLRRRSA